MDFNAPEIDYAALSPIIALTAGLVVVLMAAVFDPVKRFGPALAAVTFLAALGLTIWQWDTEASIVSGALRVDGLSATMSSLILGSAAVAVMLSIREPAADEAGRSDYHALLIGSVLGMVMLTQANSLLTFFIALELLSIPLYVLCATHMSREGSLESGLKYLIVGSVGSATLLYGMAFLYGGSGATEFIEIGRGLAQGGLLSDSLILVGMGLVLVGLAFKASIAPFHQWTPDVYQGAPTPITAFMAVATKVAAFAIFLRFFDIALVPLAQDWDGLLAILAAVSMVVGNVGALRQSSIKRMMGYSSIAQAGYMLTGIVLASSQAAVAGVDALVFYLAAYVAMNLAVFSVVVARERQVGTDEIEGLRGLGRSQPLLAWPLTIGMLALAGLPLTSGFIGKIFLVEALVYGDWTWLGVMIVIGTMISLGYYLRVLVAVWMGPREEAAQGVEPSIPAIAGASPEADPVDPDAGRRPYLVLPAVLGAAATVFFGVIPQPLVDFSFRAGEAIVNQLF